MGKGQIRLFIAIVAAIGAAPGWASSLPADPLAPFRIALPGIAPAESSPQAVPFAATAVEVMVVADPARRGLHVEAHAAAPVAGANIERHYRALLGSPRNARVAVIEEGRVFLRGAEPTYVARAEELSPLEPGLAIPEASGSAGAAEDTPEPRTEETLHSMGARDPVALAVPREPLPEDIPLVRSEAIARSERRLQVRNEPAATPDNAVPPLDGAAPAGFSTDAGAQHDAGWLAQAAAPRAAYADEIRAIASARGSDRVVLLTANQPALAWSRPEETRRPQPASIAAAVEARGRVELGSRDEAGEWLVLRPVSMAGVRGAVA